MIWYLLYPLRGLVSQVDKGTTEAPVLSPSHPLRKASARYGRYAARHVVTTLLVSAAMATILGYPIPFLFTTDFINGASNLPHHVWTVAQPLPYSTVTEPDIIMRSVWVHGSYMQALTPELLLSTLDLQDELLGTTEEFDPGADDISSIAHASYVDGKDLSVGQRDAVHAINGLTNQSWFFHSPLQYWHCSRDQLLADDDVLSTVNQRKTMSTPVNVTLRHSVVFSGKRFEYRKLLAADALVITLLHRRDSPVGRQWERKAEGLAEALRGDWDVYPSDGRVSASRLYEFQFRPMSTEDTLTLTLAYGLAFGYFIMSLFKVRAVKSKFGLIVTVITQIVFAIMSSFTVCAVFNIDLSRIPRAAYPVALLAMSLENIFRLINAVIRTPSEDSTTSRIGSAFGETAPIALASTGQNVFILVVISRLVSPGVSAFCIFLALAIIFDLFYLSTFFLAVLSVDVRRTELSDALAKASMRHQRHHRHATESRGRTWVGKMIHGRTALSTRIAGTFVMVGFIVIAQWHFFQEQTMLNTTIGLFWDSAAHIFGSSKASDLEEINQARSPTSWLRLQDHETAQELINIIKPSAHSYIAQVYEPLVFVQKGADRSRRGSEPTLLPAYYDFINHQLTQFVVIVVVVIAALRLLISFLLYEDETNIEEESDEEDLPLLSVAHLPEKHALDIALLATSNEGHVVSAGLDRLVQVWHAGAASSGYTLPEPSAGNVFPILSLVIDDDSRWLSILSPDRLSLWSLSDKAWGPSVPIDLSGQRPESVFFAQQEDRKFPTLVIVRRNGTLTEVNVQTDNKCEDHVICDSSIVSAGPLTCRLEQSRYPMANTAKGLKTRVYLDGGGKTPSQLFIVAASKTGSVHVARRSQMGWHSRAIAAGAFGNQKVHQIVGMSSLGLCVVATPTLVHVVNVENCEVLHSVTTATMKPRSLQNAYMTQRISHVDTPGITSSTIAYIEADSGDCILHTFTPPEDDDSICLGTPSGALDGEGCEWSAAKTTQRRVRNPGHFNILSDGSLVGIRRKRYQQENDTKEAGDNKESLRNRFSSRGTGNHQPIEWEVWTVSPSARTGTDEEEPLFRKGEQPKYLLISDLGPRTKLGTMSAVFAFGNVLKLVAVGGPERFEGSTEDNKDSFWGTASRRRKGGASWRPRAWT